MGKVEDSLAPIRAARNFFYEKIDKRDATGETRFLRQQELSNFIEPSRSYRSPLRHFISFEISENLVVRHLSSTTARKWHLRESKSQSFGADKLVSSHKSMASSLQNHFRSIAYEDGSRMACDDIGKVIR
jgi:hypothetical protein